MDDKLWRLIEVLIGVLMLLVILCMAALLFVLVAHGYRVLRGMP